MGSQQLAGALELRFQRWAEDAVIANFGGAGWQDVLKEAMNELDAGKRHVGNLLSSIVAVAKTNVTALDGFDTAVSDNDAEDVARQILKDCVAAAGMLGMNDPFFRPDCRGRVFGVNQPFSKLRKTSRERSPIEHGQERGTWSFSNSPKRNHLRIAHRP